MNYALINANVYLNGSITKQDIYITNNLISHSKADNATVIDCTNKYIFPGFIDVHVHLREPGFTHKETIATGTLAAASAGYTHICSMPNLNPVPHSVDNLNVQLQAIKKDALINVLPYASITQNLAGKQLSDMSNLAPLCVAFTDDGKGVQDDNLMLSAFKQAYALNKIIAAHCEDESLLDGYIHQGEYAQNHNHKGISSACEWKQIQRDINLLKQVNTAYHVCHISTKESAKLIAQAKADGLNITCETAPHYLLLSDSNLKEDGAYKMNPPLRSNEDKLALLQALKDGTIDMIATDHAPHTKEDKNKGLQNSAMGIVGIEIAFPLLYTYLVKQNIITLAKLIELMHDNASKRFNINTSLNIGQPANLCIYDLDYNYNIDNTKFLSMGQSTPFNGYNVYGKNMFTFCNGNLVYTYKEEI